MSISLRRVRPTRGEGTALIGFLTANSWPYYHHEPLSVQAVATAIANGLFDNHQHRTWWIHDDEHGTIGIGRLRNLTTTAHCDIALADSWRGQGYGEPSLRELTRTAFVTYPQLGAVHANIRADHIAMLRVFTRAGWAVGARTQRDTSAAGGKGGELIGYRLTRHSWQRGGTVKQK
ncbi:MAG: GNAT family N-acetyltransferase [Bowdeniella nasicola]|nr:GNAT family N-acetyltransferase [Bowdeniella nasicola]